jgi:GNAT superfamily N-acetyltransferase
MPGLRFRLYVGESDLPAMVATANASFAADGLEYHRTVEDVARDYANFTGCEPTADVVIAEVDGGVVGYARAWRWTQADGVMLHGQLGLVPPQWRGRGLGRALQGWIEARHRAVAAMQPAGTVHEHHANIDEKEQARTALVTRYGYRPVRHILTMLRPTLDDIPDFAMPPGLEVRPVRPEHYRLIWDAHMDALKDIWGFSPPGPGDYEAWLQNKVFQPHLWQIAWATATNEVAGQVKTFIDTAWIEGFNRQRGWTEFISVGRRWRRRGLARALVVRSLRAQRDVGMLESGLGVDSESPTGASRVYEDCGFRVTGRSTVYRKPLVP